jgi:hypothetical protein
MEVVAKAVFSEHWPWKRTYHQVHDNSSNIILIILGHVAFLYCTRFQPRFVHDQQENQRQDSIIIHISYLGGSMSIRARV